VGQATLFTQQTRKANTLANSQMLSGEKTYAHCNSRGTRKISGLLCLDISALEYFSSI